jgi:predicted ATPase
MGLVGRTAELDDVEQRLSAGRLVTLAGPGGVGKTALAHEIAARVGDRYPLGARAVDLTRVDSEDAVPGALAAQLGFDSFQTLLDTPGDREVLLLVDNCEHLLDAAATTVQRILEVCAQPTVLATSRSPLELPGESVVALAPLDVAAAGTDPAASPAVELFLARAREAGVDVDGIDLDAVGELCRRLDGLPLAIEIAAARCRTLTPAEIAERLRDGAAVLDRPRYRGARRHRSITDTIRWSYDLLGPDAQRLLDRLAVFAGPFPADDAREVASPGADTGRFEASLDELVHASLVVADTTGPRATYRLLESVRRFGLERLDDDAARTAAFDRFADHVLDRSRRTLHGGTSSWRPGVVREMVEAFDDLAEALRWCNRHDDAPARPWRLLAAMWPVVHQGRADDVVVVGRQTLERWPADHSGLAGSAVATLSTAEYVAGRPADAIHLARDALGRLTSTSIATVLLQRVLGQASRAVGDVPGALDAFAIGGRVARDLGMAAMAIELDVAHAQTCADAGDVTGALERLAASADEAAAVGSAVSEIWART